MNLLQMIRASAIEALSRRGFEIALNFSNPIYTPDTGHVLRYYSPTFVPRRTGVSIQGTIGVVVVPFEEQWKTAAQSDYTPFGMLIDNCRTLANVPIFKEASGDISEWIDMIVEEVLQLPDDYAKLSESLSKSKLGNYPVNFFFLPNRKSEAAIQWVLRRRLQ